MDYWHKFEGIVRRRREGYLAKKSPEYLREMLRPIFLDIRRKIHRLTEAYDASVHHNVEGALEELGRDIAMLHRRETLDHPDGDGLIHAKSLLYFQSKKRLEKRLQEIVVAHQRNMR